jgi:hypothetical protein
MWRAALLLGLLALSFCASAARPLDQEEDRSAAQDNV